MALVGYVELLPEKIPVLSAGLMMQIHQKTVLIIKPIIK